MGFGVIRETRTGIEAVDYGAITTPPKVPMEQRLLSIYQDLVKIIKLHRPASCAVEKLFFSRNVTTAISVGQARGVVLLACAQYGLAIAEYTPNEIKQAVAGYGGADKRQVQLMVRSILGLTEIPKPDDAADALAVSICHLHSNQYTKLISQ